MRSQEVIVIAFDHATGLFIAKGTRWNTSLPWDKAYTTVPKTFGDTTPALPNGCLGLAPGAIKWPEHAVQAWLDNGYRVVWAGAFNAPMARADTWPLETITRGVDHMLGQYLAP